MMFDYYDLLGVSPDARRDQIRAAYRALVARVHPDVNTSPDAERQTSLLNEAWSVLREATTRAAYDAAGLATTAPLSCQRCGVATPNLRFVVFARARGEGLPRHDGAMVCSVCRKIEARDAALASVLRGRYTTRRGRRLTFGSIARDARGGKVDSRTSAALLRQIGFAYARENRPSEALAALEAVLGFGADPAVTRVVARLRETGAISAAPPPVPAARAVRFPRRQRAAFGAVAAMVLVASLAGWFGVVRRPMQTLVAAPDPLARSANVDAALADAAARLAGLVRTHDVPPERAAYLFDLANDRTFSLAYGAAVTTLSRADRARNPWLVTLETTSQPSDAVEAPEAVPYVLARGCAPQSCNDGFVSIAYNAATHAVAATAFFGARWHEFGSGELTDRAMLVLGVARNRLPLERTFSLEPARETQLREFVATLQS